MSDTRWIEYNRLQTYFDGKRHFYEVGKYGITGRTKIVYPNYDTSSSREIEIYSMAGVGMQQIAEDA